MNNENDIQEKSDKLKDFLPVTLFIVLTFLLEVFGLNKATNLVISVMVSLFTFGILSATFIVIVGVAILHWYQILHVNLRWLLFFIFLVVYFVILFRSVKTLNEIKSKLPNSTKSLKK